MGEIGIRKIRKRDGTVVDFDGAKIAEAVRRCFSATGSGSPDLAEKICRSVISTLESRDRAAIPDVEDVQNLVEEALMAEDLPDAARAYILYRRQRSQLREAKKVIGVEDELKLSVSAVTVLQRRYLLKDETGNIAETPKSMFRRVATAVARAELEFGSQSEADQAEGEFFEMMSRLEFLPNSPTLMNAGTDMGQLSACFTLPIGDSIENIFETLKQMARIHQSGGGTGFSFSRLRPKNDVVKSTQGISSGPVSFMSIYDKATDIVRQGGRRRGANMGILRVDHPDIIEFVNAKRDGVSFRNFNLSVSATDEFMDSVKNRGHLGLVNPRSGRVAGKVRAQEIFELIIANAWEFGDPGVIFIDEINRHQPTPALGEIESTNPCGEMPLLPYESCNLGSINLARMVADGHLDWAKLERTVAVAVRFLDDVIEVNNYPLPEVEQLTRANRKIGLGVMGFADLLIALGIPYNSSKALETAENVMRFVAEKSRQASVKLAETRGSFPNIDRSVWPKRGYPVLRNATTTTVAPTGTISIIAGCSSGIEPLFALSFRRNIMEGTEMVETHERFAEMLRARGLHSDDLMAEIARCGSIAGMKAIPAEMRRLFVTTTEVAPRDHVRMQASFQQHVDNAVSKTVNLPADCSIKDVGTIYRLAFRLKCKGITVYRAGSKTAQPISWGETTPRLGLEDTGACSPERCFY